MKNKLLEVDEIVETRLSAIVGKIEELVKPFQHTLKVEIDKSNCVPMTIRITAEIKSPK
jgi:hypothetical protein